MAEKMKYPVAQIRVDNGLWDVPSEPLPNGMSGNFRANRVSQSTDDVFAISPSFGSIAFVSLFLGIGIIVFSCFVYSWTRQGFPLPEIPDFWSLVGWIAGSIFGSFCAVVFLNMFLDLLTRTTRFDKLADEMQRRSIFRTVLSLPLTDIVAVQCLYAGRASGKGGSYDILQLNLVVATGDAPRILLCTEPHEAWIRNTAGQLAEFLGVPLVDQIAQTRAIYEANRFKWW